MKVFNFVFIILFIISAALQYNDPDPYLWMPIYLFGAYLCWQSIIGKFNPTLYWIGFVGYGAYAIYKIFDTNGVLDWMNLHHEENIAATMKAEKPWIEETREFFGLLILIGVLLVNYIYLARKKTVKK